MKIGDILIAGHAALAPMAGVADRAFRTLCRGYGAAFTVSEMVSGKGLTFGDRKSRQLLELDPGERPSAVQLFGSDPDTLARAAEAAMEAAPDWIDINMGCPAPKIAGNGCGSALLRDPELCGRLVAAVKAAAGVPVTAKIRIGYSRERVNGVEVALACEAGGAAALTVHGRTRDQMYAPPVDYGVIRQVKQAVKIPVIANGDVTGPLSAAAVLERTGADMVMVGHLTVPALDEVPAPFSYAIVTELLRNELGFDGVVISDALQMDALGSWTSGEAAVLAVRAGVDLLLCPSDLTGTLEALEAAVEDGTISEGRIDESVLRILRMKLSIPGEE